MDNAEEHHAIVPLISKDFNSETDYGNGTENNAEEDAEAENAEGEGQKTNHDEDEEGFVDRYEKEIEDAVAEFEDEEFMGHNTIPDSSDEDEDCLVIRDRKMKNKSKERLAVGSSFYTGFEFKEAVLEYIHLKYNDA